MKIVTKFFLFVFAIGFVLTGCTEQSVDPESLTGTYAGSFQFSDLHANFTTSGEVELTFTSEGFVCSGNPTRVPAGGSGTFRQKSDVIIFDEKHVWRPNFDLNLVLRGEYKYKQKQNTLHLWKEVNNNRYEYVLEKR